MSKALIYQDIMKVNVMDELERIIIKTIEAINTYKKRCATYRDIVRIVGIENYSPETITRRVRTLVEDGAVKRWKTVSEQRKGAFYVVSFWDG